MAKKKNKQRNNPSNSHRSNDEMRISVSMRKKYGTMAETDKYSRGSSEYRSLLKKMTEEVYNNNIHSLKNYGGKNLVERLKLDGPYRKRHLSAILEYVYAAAPGFAEKYPMISVEDEIVDFISELYNMLPMEYEHNNHITIAMAIFILDAVAEASNIEEASFFIPYEKDIISEVSLPENFSDSMYDDDLIRGMAYLIIHRNDENSEDCFINNFTARISSENGYIHNYRPSKLFFDDKPYSGDELYDEAQKMSYPERYKRVLSYIRPEIIERAVARYKNRINEIVDIFLSGIEPVVKQKQEQINRALGICNEIERYENMLFDARKRADECKGRKQKPSIMCMGNFNIDEDSEYDKVMEEADAIIEKLKKKAEAIDDVTDELESLDQCIFEHQFDIRNYLCSRDEIGTEIRDKEFVSALDSLRALNPFEVFFAYLYLLDTGDSSAWIMYITEIILGSACSDLPWAKEFNDSLIDFIEERDQKEIDENDNNCEKFVPVPERYVEDRSEYWERLFTQEYTDYHVWSYEGAKRIKKSDLFHLNLSQVVYNASGMCIPRKKFFEVDCYDDNGLKKAGFSAKEIPLLRDYLSLGAYASIRYGFDSVYKVKLKRTLTGTDKPKDDTENLKAKITSINEENASLKNQLYKAEKALKDYKEKVSAELSEQEADRQELIELRELVYKLQNSSGAEPEIENADKIQLPYTTKQRVVIFGGHATWLKAIKPMLPNVKFIDPYTKPDANLIRHADVVWMQTNAMPHSFYGKIMEIVRQRKIPVKYFAYASADKCAKQLAEDDMKIDIDQ